MDSAATGRFAGKIFCISLQRTGTTSVGHFFRDFGWRWAGWPADEANGWSSAWYRGDFEAIFGSADFLRAEAFEDSPWWLPDFYKVVFQRVPGARFVLFTREEEAWFRSMLSHSDGFTIGDNREHAKAWRREPEFFARLAAGEIDDTADGSGRRMTMHGHREHYLEQYRRYHVEVADFFARHAPSALHLGRLEDPGKWLALGKFLGIEVPAGYDVRANASVDVAAARAAG